MIPIVLTGTIIPNAIKTAHIDIDKRKQEYLAAINYYKTFSKVYFIENSEAELGEEFHSISGLQIIRMPKSNQYSRGKGYQEFQMLDNFVSNHLIENCFVKVTGRYIIKNFKDLYEYTILNSANYDAIIDTYPRKKYANTWVFYSTKAYYLKSILNTYLNMNDADEHWAEHQMFQNLDNSEKYTFFSELPINTSMSGSTMEYYVNSKFKCIIKNAQRKIFYKLGIRNLYL